MMVYRDRRFCTAKCGNSNCHIKYTPAVQAGAEAWWGGPDAPIDMGDRSSTCGTYVPLKEGK